MRADRSTRIGWTHDSMQIADPFCKTSPHAISTQERGLAMLNRFDVPVLAVVENMASFRCGAAPRALGWAAEAYTGRAVRRCGGCGEEHFPFGRGHL